MLVCATLFWAGNFTIGKLAFLENMPPNTLAFLWWTLVCIILFPFTYKEVLKLKNKIANIVLNKGINDKKIPALFAPIIETAPAQQ